MSVGLFLITRKCIVEDENYHPVRYMAGLKSPLLGEHGLAMLIERGRETYLFDTGQGQTLFHNAISLGKDLRKVNKIFLSHGHYDHTGVALEI